MVDDGDHQPPTKANIMQAYRNIVSQSQSGDSIFLHYSGHGTKVRDTSGDEDDGYDEALVPLDFQTAGIILDDEMYDLFVKGLPAGVHVVALVRLRVFLSVHVGYINNKYHCCCCCILFLMYYAFCVCRMVCIPQFLLHTQMDCCHSGTVLDLPYVFKVSIICPLILVLGWVGHNIFYFLFTNKLKIVFAQFFYSLHFLLLLLYLENRRMARVRK